MLPRKNFSTLALAIGLVLTSASASAGFQLIVGGAGLAPPAPSSAPTLSSVSPARISTSGGDLFSVFGENLETGSTVLVGGATPIDIWYTSITQLDVFAPGLSAGTYDVEVSNGNGSDILANALEMVDPAYIASVSPNTGLISGGYSVTISGDGFTDATQVQVGGAATPFTLVDDQTISVSMPSHAAGSVNMRVDSPFGSDLLLGAFDYLNPLAFTAVTPNIGSIGGGETVTLTASGWTTSTTVSFGGTPATILTRSPAFTVAAPAHVAGVVDVVMNDPVTGTQTLTGSYTYETPVLHAVTGITPDVDAISHGGLVVTVTGTGFSTSNATVDIGGSACTVQSRTATAIECQVGTHTTPGVYDVSVTSDSQVVALTDGFTYIPDPNITSVSPTAGPEAGSDVLVQGVSFHPSDEYYIVDTYDPIAFTYNDSTSVTLHMPARSAGLHEVDFWGYHGGSEWFEYTYEAAAPSISSITPNSGSTDGGETVAISGTDLAGASVTFGGTTATVTANTDTSLSVTTPAKTEGAVDVVVTTASGSDTVIGGYTYNAPSPPPGPLTVTVGALEGGLVTELSFGFGEPSLTVSGGTPPYTYTWTSLNAQGGVHLFGGSGMPGGECNSAVTAAPVNVSWAPSCGGSDGGSVVNNLSFRISVEDSLGATGHTDYTWNKAGW